MLAVAAEHDDLDAVIVVDRAAEAGVQLVEEAIVLRIADTCGRSSITHAVPSRTS